ncbi:MAG: hypothetical protein QM734_07060 [Cyclobacteriaceae bacterium]
MRVSVIAFIFTVLLSCKNTTDPSFKELREKLPLIKTPIRVPCGSCGGTTDVDLPENKILSNLQKKYNDRTVPFYVDGKVFDTEEYIAIIGQIPAASGVPIILIFDNKGNQIDSLVVSYGGGYSVDSTGALQSYSYGQILNDKQILSVDSIVQWDVEIIQGVPFPIEKTQTATVTRRRYKILDSGKIKELE